MFRAWILTIAVTVTAVLFPLFPPGALAQPTLDGAASQLEPIADDLRDLTTLSPDELKIRLAPLRLNELEGLRDEVIAALRERAAAVADLLIQQLRTDGSPDPDPTVVALLNEDLAKAVEAKTALQVRANLILDAIEAKGGDVAGERAYVAAIHALRPDTPTATADPDQIAPEETEKAAVRDRVANLIGVIRAEPPIHERPKPWEIPVTELELELQPLTLEQIEQRLEAWRNILQREVRRRVRFDILLNNPDRLAEARESRDEAARLTGIPQGEIDAVPLDTLKAELALQSQNQQQIVRAVVKRMNATIRLIQLRGGDAKSYIDYIASATGQKLNLYDPTVLYAQTRAWIFARDGGVEVGLRIAKFVGVMIAFWFLSMIVGWIAGAGVGRLPGTSSLLRPMLVNNLRRLTMLIGLVLAVTALGVSAAPLLAMIGAAGLVVGLALQGTLSNFASGIMILINRPFDVGDAISAGGIVGKVEAMNLVSTQILTFDNQLMLVPNNVIWNGVITNITGRKTRRVDLTFGIAYSDDVDKAIEILGEIMKAHPKVLADPAPIVKVHAHGDNSVNLIARPWVKTAEYWDVYWDMMHDVKLRFDEGDINIPFPQRDLHLPGPIEVTLSDRGRGNGSTASTEDVARST